MPFPNCKPNLVVTAYERCDGVVDKERRSRVVNNTEMGGVVACVGSGLLVELKNFLNIFKTICQPGGLLKLGVCGKDWGL